jgi:hypothetical protein
VGPLTSSSRAPWVKYFSSLWSFSNETESNQKAEKSERLVKQKKERSGKKIALSKEAALVRDKESTKPR